MLNLSVRSLCLFAVVLLLTACDLSGSPVCGGGPTEGYSEAPDRFAIDMGSNSGTFNFDYETRNAKDRIQVLYAGNVIFDSGCVSESRAVSLRYGPGRDTHVDVKVTPNCSGTPMTSWKFDVGCPTPLVRETDDNTGKKSNSTQSQRY